MTANSSSENQNAAASTQDVRGSGLSVTPGSPLHVLRYQSITGQKMWVVEIGDAPEPGDEYGRNIRGSNRLRNAKVFTPDEAEAMLHKVREVHRDAWIERASGLRHRLDELRRTQGVHPTRVHFFSGACDNPDTHARSIVCEAAEGAKG